MGTLAPGKRDLSLQILGCDRLASGEGLYARISGGADDLGDAPARGKAPGQRVFARPGADNEEFHDAPIRPV